LADLPNQRKLINVYRQTIVVPPSKQQDRYPDVADWDLLYIRQKFTFVDIPNQAFEFNKVRDLVNGNHILFKKGKATSEKCTFCPCPDQTNWHLFVDCPVIDCFWKQIQILFLDVTGPISPTERMFGRVSQKPKDPETIATNHVIMITCQVIHKNNINTNLPTTKEVIHSLMQLYFKENIYFSTKSQKKWNYFYEIWRTITKCINKEVPFSVADGIPKPILSQKLQQSAANLQEFLEIANALQENF
jgi:hypothetical protein